MEKTKNNSWLNRIKNERNVKSHRKLSRKIQYLLGLKEELQHELALYVQNSTEKLNRYFEEDAKPYKEKLAAEFKYEDRRQKKIARLENKLYWMRRRFKHVNRNQENLEELLVAWDQEHAIASRIEVLDQTMPRESYSDQEKQAFQSKIDKFDSIRQRELHKIQGKYEKLSEKTTRKQIAIQNLIDRYHSACDELANKIEVYNKEQYEADQLSLASLKNQADNHDVNEVNALKIKHNIERIETKVEIANDQDIHLAVSNLKMFFGGIKAINDLSFNVRKGEIFGLIGPNGAGKTTVFNCITQFYKPTSGNTFFRNKENNIVDLQSLKTHQIIDEGIARSFQNVELIWELTVLDNLLVAAHSLIITDYFEHMVHTRKMHREEAVLRTKGMGILANLGIAEYAFRSPYGLPYGILKKIELARTLMTNPSLIILDEPAAGLNDTETAELAKTIKKINQEYNVTIFLVEHDMHLVMSICDTICAISFGKMLAIGTPAQIQQNADVRKAYLGEDDDE